MTEVIATRAPAEPVDVGAFDELPIGAFKLVDVDGRSIGVLRTEDGAVHAILNHCPHRSAPVCLGRVSGTLHSDEPGKLEYAADRLVLACPWHGWEFELESGRTLGVSSSRLAVFPAEVVDGRVLVQIRRRAPKADGA